MTSRASLLLVLGSVVLICAFAHYCDPRGGKAEQPPSASEADCAVIERQWSARTGKDALYAMRDDAMSAAKEGHVGIASCTLQLAISRAWNSRNDTLAYRFSAVLADLYLQTRQFEKARRILVSVLAHLDKDSESNRIRRVETYLRLISVGNSTGDKNSVSSYIAEAQDEAKDLTMGILTKDRLFLAAIEHFEAEGNYVLAARNAKDLLTLRQQWNATMPNQIDSAYVESARQEYQRLKELIDQ